MSDVFYNILIWSPGVIFAITLHEWAHGYVAYLFGDDTAKSLGRLTLNPLPHIDPVMTLLVPGLMFITSMMTMGTPFVFGSAKPVPVNMLNFKRAGNQLRIAQFWVAIAGPLLNFILALACVLLLRVLYATTWMPAMIQSTVQDMLVIALQMNVLLGVFNMLPLPPLDGGRVATALLPHPLDRTLGSLERFGFPIVLILAFSGVLGQVLSPAMSYIINLFVRIASIT